VTEPPHSEQRIPAIWVMFVVRPNLAPNTTNVQSDNSWGECLALM